MTANPRAPQLTLSAAALPSVGVIGAPIRIRYILRNPTHTPVCVNARMLVNSPGQPGELSVELHPPDGYEEKRGYRIRAGSPDDRCFVDLAPGKELRGEFPLDRYHSLDTPGAYRLVLRYANEVTRAPDGRRVAAVRVAAVTRFHRTLPGDDDSQRPGDPTDGSE